MGNIPDHYSLFKEHDGHFELHDGRDDSKFQVSKKDLHPATQIKIMKMKNFAHGGLADPEDTGEDGTEEGVKNPLDIDGIPVSQVPPPGLDAPAPQAAPAPPVSLEPPQAQSMPMPQAAPVAPGISQELNSSIDTQKNALQFEANAQQAQNTSMAAQMQKNIAAEQSYMETQNKRLMDYQNHYDEMVRQVASEKIDPKRFINNMSTAQKITSSIGLMLSGLGAGLQGGPNIALQMLNRDIDNDIESQKENLGRKHSLLGENLRAQGNMMSAMNMTRLQMSAIAQGKLQLIAAQTGNPIIAARAQAAAAAITQNSIPARAQLANYDAQLQARQEVMGRLSGNGKAGVQPVDMFDLARAGLVDKATAEKESAAISKREQAEAYVLDQFQQLSKEQTIMGGTLTNGLPNIANPESYSRRDKLRAGIIQAIQSASSSKRLTPEAIAMQIEPFLVKTLESDTTRQVGLNGILGLIRSHADPTPMASHFKLPGAIGGKNTNIKKFEMGPVK